MVEGGRTPVLPFPKMEQLGFKLAIYPNSLTRLFARVGQDLLGSLKTTGNTAAMANQMLGSRPAVVAVRERTLAGAREALFVILSVSEGSHRRFLGHEILRCAQDDGYLPLPMCAIASISTRISGAARRAHLDPAWRPGSRR